MWLLYALTFAILSSILVILAKKIMKDLGEYAYLWLSGLFTIPSLLFIVIKFYQIPQIDNTFLLVVTGSVILDVIAGVAAYRALKISEISLLAPFSAFNPVFIAVTSMLFLKEGIDSRGWIGILTICLGAYLLQISKANKDLLAPFKNMFADKGIRLVLLAYLIWSITPLLQKTAINHTNPEVPPFASLSGLIGTNIIFGLLVLRSKIEFKKVKKHLFTFIFVGILTSIAQASAFNAFSLTNLGFASAIFKLSMIFSVIFGWLFFREKDLKNRLLGSMVMLVGVFLLVL